MLTSRSKSDSLVKNIFLLSASDETQTCFWETTPFASQCLLQYTTSRERCRYSKTQSTLYFHYTTDLTVDEKHSKRTIQRPNNRIYSKHTLEYTGSYCTVIKKCIHSASSHKVHYSIGSICICSSSFLVFSASSRHASLNSAQIQYM